MVAMGVFCFMVMASCRSIRGIDIIEAVFLPVDGRADNNVTEMS